MEDGRTPMRVVTRERQALAAEEYQLEELERKAEEKRDDIRRRRTRVTAMMEEWGLDDE
ncbi:MAG: hypothetical protein VX529_09565 [Pseudomonadota bacterium]|nr:hypothetical protein [Pseudomonadota bacterium]